MAVAESQLAPDEYRSCAFLGILAALRRLARDESVPILLQGESGTGKTALARFIHSASSRRNGAFQHVVLSTIQDSVGASELFGHVPGAFTDARTVRAGYFVSANGGTLFLDELGKAPLHLQGQLLHAVEYSEIRPLGSDRVVKVNARLVLATNVDLGSLVEIGAFLPDLYARVALFRVIVPPLRERRADIPALARQSIMRHRSATGYQGCAPGIEPRLMDALKRAPWPHNLRQLDATVHRLMLEADGAMELRLSHCTGDLEYLVDAASSRAVTNEQIRSAVKTTGSLAGAARLLGLDRKTLRNKLQAGLPSSSRRTKMGHPTDDPVAESA